MKADTVIIGGGLAGVTTFHELVSRGIDTILLDAHPDVALGTSYANGAMLTPSMSDPWNSPGVGAHIIASVFDPAAPMKLRLRNAPGLAPWGLAFLRNSTPARHAAATLANFRLADYSVRQTLSLVDRLGVAMDSNDRGTMKVFESVAAMATPVRLAKMLEAHGLNYRVVDAAGAVAIEPALAAVAHRIHGALYYPDDGVGDARKFTSQVASAARQSGGRLLFDAPVGRVDRTADGSFRLATGAGEIEARRVVLAAGTATPSLARSFGVALPIKPAKGYSLTYDMTDATGRPTTAIVDDAMHAAVVPLGDRIRVVGTADFAGDDRRVEPQRIDNLARLFARLYPALASQLDRSRAEAWAGLRPMSADGRPFIGASGKPGLWVNAGHGHLGWTMAVGSARLLTQLMLGDAPEIDPGPFAIGERGQ